MSYEGSCPSCGALVVFQLGSSLLRVCEHCGVAVAREGADLVNYGRVAALLPTPSVLALGLEGGYEGAPPFRLVGRLQLDHGAGTWDEWLLAFAGESWAWLSEAQGKFHYTAEAPLPPVPSFEQIRVGQAVDLGPPGVFVVTEVRAGRFMTGAGELPFAVRPGTDLHYADLSGRDGQFATLDYGTGTTAEALYVGREVTLDELGIRNLPDEEARRKRVGAEGLKCPQCAGPVEVRVPDQAQRVACPWCGSLLDAAHDFAVLEALARPTFKPVLPLGAQGTLEGVSWTVIGAMERSVTIEDVRYPWIEHLLYEPHHGFRWLVVSSGHWSFVEPVNPGDLSGDYDLAPIFDGLHYKHFQGASAVVDGVLGEFYWAVKQGDRVDTHDFVAPPFMLSKEEDGQEVTWSRGSYRTPDEVWQAFALPGEPPPVFRVGAQQPSPWGAKRGPLAKAAALAAVAVLGLFFLFSALGRHRVFSEGVSVPATAVPGAPESAVFLGPVVVPRDGNLQVRVESPVSNSWLFLSGALINDATGAVDEFDAEVSYYYGSDSDGAWSEGDIATTAYLGSVPAGRYTLRLEPQWELGRNPGRYQVDVKSRVPRFHHVVLAVLALWLVPGYVIWRHMRFEVERWSESDHPMVTSGESDDDDSSGDD